MEIAHVRILRLAVGTALSMWVSQAAGWSMSFIAPVMTMFILALPLPAPKLKGGVLFVAALTLSMYAGMLLLPPLLNYPLVGLLLLILALFWSFYFTAKGGSPLVGTLLTVGIALTAAVGTVSVDVLLLVIQGVVFGAAVGVAFVWIAHWVFPDRLAGPLPPRPPPGR